MAHAKHAKPVIFPQSRAGAQDTNQENPFDPYKVFSQAHASPFFMSHKLLHTWFEMNQKFWQNYVDYTMWRNKALLEMMIESSRWVMHSAQLMGNPQAYHRYLRANWQKPFMSLNAHALTSARMLTHMFMENGTYFQKTMMNILKDKQTHTHH
jgi:hypothetical protein